jgi:hypothetical protein
MNYIICNSNRLHESQSTFILKIAYELQLKIFVQKFQVIYKYIVNIIYIRFHFHGKSDLHYLWVQKISTSFLSQFLKVFINTSQKKLSDMTKIIINSNVFLRKLNKFDRFLKRNFENFQFLLT